MTYQPKDVSHYMFDENKFKNLPTVLSFPDDFQITTSKSDIDPGDYLPSESDELLLTNIVSEYINEIVDSCATSLLTPSYYPNEQSSPEYQFDESHLLNPFEDPSNEVIITTSPSDVANINIPSELNLDGHENLTPDEIATFLRQSFDEFALQSIDNSIQQRTMSIENQPPVNLRPRYKSDGTRQIEKSRTKPMAVKLPDLKGIELDSGQSFLLRLALIKCSKNSSDQAYLHVNKLEYHSDDVQELSDETVCVPLTSDDIAEGKKVLPRLSIVKTKLEAYKSELIPYNLSRNDDKLLDIDKNEKLSAKEAKKIFKQFNLKASRIACQLLIKQNESIHYTDIACETHVLKEKDQKCTAKKRSAKTMDSDDEESQDERPSTSKSKSTKRKKFSN